MAAGEVIGRERRIAADEADMTRMTIHEMLRQARVGLLRLSPAEAYAATEHLGWVLVDIRTSEGRARAGRLPNALEISLNVLEWRLDPDSPSQIDDSPGVDDPVILICEQGYSSSLAAARLQRLGFVRATDVVGGFEAWRSAGLPVDR
jgi:rhodanese-related sulfurtransferase